MINAHITSLGYRLETTTDLEVVAPLLEACRMNPIQEPGPQWETSTYLIACTLAGGIAACVGWNRRDDSIVLHSLAVAPTSRGSGIGGGLLASAMGDLMDSQAVPACWLTTESSSARRLFTSTGFVFVDGDDVPAAVREHPTFASATARSRPMARRYQTARRGLDNCAFRLILNNTEDATLPLGSVFFFRQTGEVIEASYRGGPVRRGHIIGAISGDQLRFCWHQYVDEGALQSGDGSIYFEQLPDGRRELRETLSGATEEKPNELHLREV